MIPMLPDAEATLAELADRMRGAVSPEAAFVGIYSGGAWIAERTREYVLRAFAEGEFEMYFQPKVDARTREWCGLEALVRWNHPEDGLLVPEA